MIEKKLQECRVELQNKKLKKSGENKFAKFKYYELTDFLPTVNQMFLDKGIFSSFSIIDGEAVLKVVDTEDGTEQEFLSPIADAELKGCTPIQSLGAIHTYMKRYLYLNALEIVESDALDASVGSEEFKPKLNDSKIYIDLAKLTDLEQIKNYYENNKDKVNEPEKLKQRARELYKSISDAKKMFEGVENG
jgi:hypothetical protein